MHVRTPPTFTLTCHITRSLLSCVITMYFYTAFVGPRNQNASAWSLFTCIVGEFSED